MQNQKQAQISLGVYGIKEKNVIVRFFLWCAYLFGGNEPEPVELVVSVAGGEIHLVTWRDGNIAFVKINKKNQFWSTCMSPAEVARINIS